MPGHGYSYITMLGRSVWSLANSYYAALRERGYCPDSVYIFVEDAYRDDLPKAKGALEAISEGFGLKPWIAHEFVTEGDFIDAGKKVSAVVKDLKKKKFEVALDITPGRKALVAGALLSISKVGVDHVFYLKIKTLDDVSKPYMMIPLKSQELMDFVQDVKREKVNA